MRKQQIIVILLLILGGGINLAVAQGTAFTYQGVLTDSSGPLNGFYDLTFTLYDSPGPGGNPVPPLGIGSPNPNTKLNFQVSGGLVTTTLDFGPSAFTGGPRWLEITVHDTKPGGATTTLSPRQQLTPLPYAIYAENAATVASGSVVQSLNGLKDNVTLAAGANVTLTPSGNTLTIASAAGGTGIWSPIAGGGTYYNGGNVGIGISAPHAPLEIDSSASDLSNQEFLRLSYGPSDYHSISAFFNGGPGQSSLSFNVEYASGDIRPTMTLNGTGVGIGTANPQQKLEVAGNWLEVDGGLGQDAIMGSPAYGNDVVFGSINPSVTNIDFWNPNNGFLYATCNGLTSFGPATVCVLTITGGCDVSEPFDISEQGIPKGAVVVIDDEHSGRLRMSGSAYDTRVAGIISGANGINPGLSLRQQGVNDGGQNVALSGRVYALADASYGPIRAGDLLTTSDTPGHCMKVIDHARAQGAVIGKAMSSLEDGKGIVLVLVSLQ